MTDPTEIPSDHVMMLEISAAAAFPTVTQHGSGFSITAAASTQSCVASNKVLVSTNCVVAEKLTCLTVEAQIVG